MPNYTNLEPLFHPHSVALAGITVTNPEHWTRTFLDSLLEFQFQCPIYLVNPKGGEIKGLRVYRSLTDIPGTIDYVIGLVPAKLAPALVEECASKEVKAIHFCTAGFSETGEEEGVKLETELTERSRKRGIRILGPNCMGVYCPESHLSFQANFPKESGPVGFISQSGGNAIDLVNQVMWRGVRFSKVISYGNACDLNESDFLEYLTADPNTRIITMYIEGVKDGRRFRQTLQKAAKEKPVILLKGGVTESGARAVSGHTGALAGSEAVWDSLCKQLGVLQVRSLEEMADVLVTLLFMPLPKGRRVVLLGGGGGASVLITDEFERRGLKVPPLPQQIRNQIREFTPVAGNILRNPIDYSQTMIEPGKLAKTVGILSRWDGIDLLMGFLRPTLAVASIRGRMAEMINEILEGSRLNSKPIGLIIEPSTLPQEAKEVFPIIQKCVSSGLPVYYSFAGAASAISLVLSHYERHPSQPRI